MKKLVYLLLPIWILSCWCCSPGSDEPVVKPDPAPIPQDKIEVTTSEPVIEEKGGKATVGFTATAAWTITVSRSTSWCTVTPTSGTAGTHELTITTTPNDTYDERNATITINAGQNSKSFTVRQKQKDALTATPAKNEFTAEGGELVIEVKANISFETIIDEACKEWITTSESRALKTSTLKFNIAPNEDLEKREGKITVKSGEFNEEIKVYQEGGKPVVVLTQDEYTVSSEGGDIQVELMSNVDYTVQMPDVDWLAISESRAMSSHTHHFAVLPNEAYDLRTAEIIFANAELAISDTVRITQVQKDALIVAKNEYTIEGKGGTLDFTVNTNVDFEVSTNVDWIKQNVSSRGLVEKPLSFTIEGNVAYEAREGIIIISADDLTQEVVVKQDGRETPFIVKQKYYSLPPNGSQFVVDIYYNQPYKIQGWSNGIGLATFSIKENGHDKLVFRAYDSGDLKNKEIIISDEEGLYTDTIHIEQSNINEQLHSGDGNPLGGYGAILSYTGGIISFDVYTNLEHYDVVIFGNTETHKAKHINTEKTNFGFREYFEIPMNDTGKDLEFNLACVGPNIMHEKGIIVRRQLFVHFDEPDEIYISEKGGTFTTHAWTEDDNLNIRLEGSDTSWLTVKQTDDTYVDGVRRINTTFEAEANNTGKTREITIVANNGFNDNDAIRIIQPSGDFVLLSREKMIVGAWDNSQIIILKDCEYTIETDKSAPWVTIGEATKANGAINVILKFEANKQNNDRNANWVIKSGNITQNLNIKQLPESGALVDDSNERWKSYQLPPVDVKKPYPNQMGSMLYFAIVEDPEEFIHIQSRRVLDLLYYTPEDEFIPKLKYLEYVLDNYDGVSACYGGGGMKGIVLSNQYVESYYNANGARALVEENKGVLAHELTHAFQLEPKGCGDYGSSKVFHSCIEGMADAVRVLSGGFPHESDRPKGGHYLDSYRYTGFFIAWCVKNKDKDFLRKFNLSTQYVNPWSFDGAIKYVLGEEYNVEDLWKEYLKAMGDLK